MADIDDIMDFSMADMDDIMDFSTPNTNLLEETVEILHKNGKSLSDICFVASSHGATDTGTFVSAADKWYDSGFGGEEVLRDLIVVGKDWWLERHEYDGSEWWEYKELPKMPDNVWKDVKLFYQEY